MADQNKIIKDQVTKMDEIIKNTKEMISKEVDNM
jgi:hypothetical protein